MLQYSAPRERSPVDSLDDLLAELPPLLTVEEVAEALRVTPTRVRKQLGNGTLPGYRPAGSRWMIAKSELVAWMRAGSNRHLETDQGQTHESEPTE